jgi:hypothetical protein
LYKTPPAFCVLALVAKVHSLTVKPDDWNRMAPPTDWLVLLVKLQPLIVTAGLFPPKSAPPSPLLVLLSKLEVETVIWLEAAVLVALPEPTEEFERNVQRSMVVVPPPCWLTAPPPSLDRFVTNVQSVALKFEVA